MDDVCISLYENDVSGTLLLSCFRPLLDTLFIVSFAFRRSEELNWTHILLSIVFPEPEVDTH